MNIKELIIDYQTVLYIGGFIASLVGLYFKLIIEMKANAANFDLKIETIRLNVETVKLSVESMQLDRENRWDTQKKICSDRQFDFDKISKNQQAKDDKMEAYLSDISKGVVQANLKIEGLIKDVEWLKKDSK